MVHSFAWKQVKRNVSRTVKWREQQQKNYLLDVETLQTIKIFVYLATRPQRPGMTSQLKKLLADCFKSLADGPKTGLLAARAISSLLYFIHSMLSAMQQIGCDLQNIVWLHTQLRKMFFPFCISTSAI